MINVREFMDGWIMLNMDKNPLRNMGKGFCHLVYFFPVMLSMIQMNQEDT